MPPMRMGTGWRPRVMGTKSATVVWMIQGYPVAMLIWFPNILNRYLMPTHPPMLALCPVCEYYSVPPTAIAERA